MRPVDELALHRGGPGSTRQRGVELLPTTFGPTDPVTQDGATGTQDGATGNQDGGGSDGGQGDERAAATVPPGGRRLGSVPTRKVLVREATDLRHPCRIGVRG